MSDYRFATVSLALLLLGLSPAFGQMAHGPVDVVPGGIFGLPPVSAVGTGWISGFKEVSIGASLTPLSYSPIVDVLIQNKITEEEFQATPLPQRQVLTTKARRIAQTQAETLIVKALKTVARMVPEKMTPAKLQSVQKEFHALNEIYGPYLPTTMSHTVDLIDDHLALVAHDKRASNVTHSLQGLISSLGIDWGRGRSVWNWRLKPLASPALPLPLVQTKIGGPGSPRKAGMPYEFHIQDQQMGLIDMTGKDGGHYLRLARFGGDQLKVIYGTREFTQLSPGESIEVGRAPRSSGKNLPTETNPDIAAKHMTIRYAGDGKASVVDHTGKGFSASAAVDGSNSIAGRYTSILGRTIAFYNDRDNYAEIMQIEITGPLRSLYDEIKQNLGTTNGDEIAIINTVVRSVRREIPAFNMAHAWNLTEAYKIKSTSLGEAVLGQVGGVCRHYAVTITVILEQLIKEGDLPGVAYFAKGGGVRSGHAWAEYEAADGITYVLDPAQHKYGPTYEHRFQNGDVDSQGQPVTLPYAQFGFPAENRH